MPIPPHRDPFPPPPDWDTFQRLTRDVYTRVWDDPNTQINGRSGQPQQGVDVYGQPRVLSGAYAGIQCKRYTTKPLTRQILEKETTAAEAFQPCLAEFYIVTTRPRDQKVQAIERKFRADRLRQGKFPVYVKFWEDVWDELRKYDDLIAGYYPDLVNLFDPYTPSRKQLLSVSAQLDQFRVTFQKSVEESLSEHLTTLRQEVNNGFVEAARSKILSLIERMEFENDVVALNSSLRENIYLFAAGVFVTDADPVIKGRVKQWLDHAHAIGSAATQERLGVIRALQLYVAKGAQPALRQLDLINGDAAERTRFGIWLDEQDFDSCRTFLATHTDLGVNSSKDWLRLLAHYHTDAGDPATAKTMAQALAQGGNNADHLMMAAYAMARLAYQQFKSFCEVNGLCPSVHVTALDLDPLIDTESKQLAADWFECAFRLFQAHNCPEQALQALEASLRLRPESGKAPRELALQLQAIEPHHPLLSACKPITNVTERMLQDWLDNPSVDPDLVLGAVVASEQSISQRQAAKFAQVLKSHTARFSSSEPARANLLIAVLKLLERSAHASAALKWVEDSKWPEAYPHLAQLLRTLLVRRNDIASASKAFDALLQKHPNNPEVLFIAIQHFREVQDAGRELSCARDLFHAIRTPQTAILLINALLANKDYNGCFDLTAKISDIKVPEDLLRRARAYAAKEIGRYSEAQQDYDWLAANAECTLEDFAFAAWVNRLLGDSQKAIGLLRQSVLQHPDKVEGYLELARTCLSSGQPADAFHWAFEAKRRFPDDPNAAAYLLQVSFPTGNDNHPVMSDLFSIFAPTGQFADSGHLHKTTIEDVKHTLEQGRKGSATAEELYRQAQVSAETFCHLLHNTQFGFRYVGNRFRLTRYIATGDQAYRDGYLSKNNPTSTGLDYSALLTLWFLYEDSWVTELQSAFESIYVSPSLPEVIQLELDSLSHRGQVSAQQSREQVVGAIARRGQEKVEVHTFPATIFGQDDPFGATEEVELAEAKGIVCLCEYPHENSTTSRRCSLRSVADALLNVGAITIAQHNSLIAHAQPVNPAEVQAVNDFLPGADIVADPDTLLRLAEANALDALFGFVGKVHVVQSAIARMQYQIDEHRLHGDVVQSLRRLQSSLGQALQRDTITATAAPAIERKRAQELNADKNGNSRQAGFFKLSRQLIVKQLVDLMYVARLKQVPIWTDDRWTSIFHDTQAISEHFSTDSYLEWRRTLNKQDAQRFAEYEKLLNWGYSGLPVHTDYLLWLLRQKHRPDSPRILKAIHTYRAYVLETWKLVREHKPFPNELALRIYGNFHQALFKTLQFCQRNNIPVEQCAQLFMAFDLARQSPLAEGMEPTFYAALLIDAFVREPLEALNPRDEMEWAEGFGHWFHEVLADSGVSTVMIQEAWHQLMTNVMSQHISTSSKEEVRSLRRWVYVLFLAAPEYVREYLLSGILRTRLTEIFGDDLKRMIVFSARFGNQTIRYPFAQQEWDRDRQLAVIRFLKQETTEWITEGTAAVRMGWLSSGSLYLRVEETAAEFLKAEPGASGTVSGLWLLPMSASDDVTERAAFWRQGLMALTRVGASTSRWLEIRTDFESPITPGEILIAESQRMLLGNFDVCMHLLRDAAQISGQAIYHILSHLQPKDVTTWLNMPELDWGSADDLKAWAHTQIETAVTGAGNSAEEILRGLLSGMHKFAHTLFPDAALWQTLLSEVLRESGADKQQSLIIQALESVQSTPSLPLKVTVSLACVDALRDSTCEDLPVAITQALDSLAEEIAYSCGHTAIKEHVGLHHELQNLLYTRWAISNKLQHISELALAYLAYAGAWIIVQELHALGKLGANNMELLCQLARTDVASSWFRVKAGIRQPMSAFKPAWNAYAEYPLVSWINRSWNAGFEQLPTCRESTVNAVRDAYQASSIMRAFMPGVNEPLTWADDLLYRPRDNENPVADATQFGMTIVDNTLASGNEQQITSTVVLCFSPITTSWTGANIEILQRLLSSKNIARIKAIPAAYEHLLWRLAELLTTQTNMSSEIVHTANGCLFEVYEHDQTTSDINEIQALILARLAALGLFVDRTATWLRDITQSSQFSVSTIRTAVRPFISAWPLFTTRTKDALRNMLLEFASSERFKNLWEATRIRRDIESQE